MSRLRALAKNQRGFTLVEMMVATALMGFVLAAALLSLQAGTQASDVTTGRAEAQSTLRFAMDRLVAEMRTTGYNPTGATTWDPVAAMGATTVILQSDLDANGTLETPAGACDAAAPAERVRYRISGNNLMRALMTGGTGTTAVCETTLISGVQSLSFTYVGDDGNTTGTAANVRMIRVALTLTPESVGNYKLGTMAAAMTDEARLRNR
jgi:prepilin-type N-terminal cleavage/methylation domain-containing protein